MLGECPDLSATLLRNSHMPWREVRGEEGTAPTLVGCSTHNSPGARGRPQELHPGSGPGAGR